MSKSSIPFLFSYRSTLFGNGFIARVEAKNGRALCASEIDGFWMYGLNPGGMAARGDDPVSAHAAFRRTFSNVLVDIAKEAGTFEQFRDAVHAFFDETNEGYEQEWTASEARPRSISISIRETVSAEDNTASLETQLAC